MVVGGHGGATTGCWAGAGAGWVAGCHCTPPAALPGPPADDQPSVYRSVRLAPAALTAAPPAAATSAPAPLPTDDALHSLPGNENVIVNVLYTSDKESVI